MAKENKNNNPHRKLKVGILTTSFPAYKGDVQSPFIFRLVRTLQSYVDVKVICPEYSVSSEEKDKALGEFEIKRFKDPQGLTSGGGIPSNLKSSTVSKSLQLFSFLKSFYFTAKESCKDCDVLHAQWALSGLVGAFIKRKHQKLILTTRGAALNIALKSRLMKKVLMFTLNRCDFLTPNNDNHKEILNQLGFTNVQTIPNGLDIKKFKPRNKLTTRRKLNLPKDKKIILFIGWLIPRKGCRYLLEAIKEVVKEEKNVQLLIIGEGILEQNLRNKAEFLGINSHVQFLGKKSPTEVPQYMNASDIFVLPSLSEGKPNVVGEAMASGLPVIATNINGTPDFIEDNKTGFLIPPKNSQILAEKIKMLLKNKALRNKLGKKARKGIEKSSLTWEDCAKEYIKIYKKILKFS